MKQSDAVQKLVESFKDEEEGINIVNAAIEKQQGSFSFMYNRVAADFTILTNKI
jgi:hypothetical protein